MRWVFTDPDGQEHPQMALEEIMVLIRTAGAAYWHASSATAGLTYWSADGARSEMVVMVKAGVGTVLLFCEPGGAKEFVFVEGASDAPITTIYPGGNAWVVPRRYFISEASAERLLREFMDTGLRPAGDCVLLGSE